MRSQALGNFGDLVFTDEAGAGQDLGASLR